jgi:ATP-dependent DNA helicase UvrD/PcrA
MFLGYYPKMAWDDGLVGTAREIAATDRTPLRVMAGPGTGKSFAMKRRVARLLEGGQDPRRILAVTFTRNAAASLVDDLHDLGVPGSENVRAGTLHAFCFALLSKQDVFEYLGRVARPIVTFAKSGVLQFEGGAMLDDLVIAGVFGPKRACTKRIRAFEAAWARLQSDAPGWPQNPKDREFHTALINWLRFHRALLIGELVPEALRYLRNNPGCDARSAFDHVIVDEYQDLNRAEQDLIQLLSGNRAIAIVGDVDQSIYRFRHANPDGIQDYNARYPGTHDEVLNECRRCPKRVIAIADHLISHNHPGIPGPRLRPLPANAAGEIHLIQWDSVEDEATGLADYIRALVARGVSPGDILVLTPRRLLGYAIRDRVSDRGIAVHSFYHEEALEKAEAQRAYALLSLLVDAEDRVALRWWLGDGSSSRRRNAYQRLRQHCEQSGMSPKAALDACVAGALKLANVTDLIDKYRKLNVTLDDLRPRGLGNLIDTLMPPLSDECSVMREAALLDLPEMKTPGDLLDCIRSNVTQPIMPEEVDYVRVMSLHKSKGLTSRVTIVSGCTHGLIPFVNFDESPDEAAATLLEQRRLFYVAITRCSETLVVSSVTRMRRDFAWKIGARVAPGRGADAPTIASQFIDELGPSAPTSKRGAAWAQSGYAI